MIGTHAEPMVVGSPGTDLRIKLKAQRDTVNLVFQMEVPAEPGTTYFEVDTFSLTEGFFRFEGLGPKQVKGKKEQRDLERLLDAFKRLNMVSGMRFPFIRRQIASVGIANPFTAAGASLRGR